MLRCLRTIAVILSLATIVGCEAPRTAEMYGKTFYLDGAGNWGFGAATVPSGLQEAGYSGDVEIYVWTTSFVPLVDQLNVGAAKLRAAALTDRIKQYRRKYPNNQLNIVCLSAGTGVAVWAVEGLDSQTRINNLVLLGSSLSSDYDVSKALTNMTGNIYVYVSPHDVVLSGVPAIGTIDGKRGVQPAGLVGMRVPPGARDRVFNIHWNKSYIDFGWTGSHTDCTSKPFVRHVLAKHVVGNQIGTQNIPATAQQTRYAPPSQ